jgi:hypothetical protein
MARRLKLIIRSTVSQIIANSQNRKSTFARAVLCHEEQFNQRLAWEKIPQRL